MLDRKSRRHMIGQHFIVGVHGTQITHELKTLISEFHIGGICYFRPQEGDPTNEPPEETYNRFFDFFRSLHEQSKKAAGGEYGPLFISVDQEGGRVQRLRAPFTLFPPMGAFGKHVEKTGDTAILKSSIDLLAMEMRSVGINWVFAPVADIFTNPDCKVIGDRAFHHDLNIVNRCIRTAVTAFRAAGVLCCAKHFPGHGDVAIDSHFGLPVVHHGTQRLETLELVPFRAAIEAGVPAIMVAHLLVNAWDPSNPSSLSRAAIRDHLLTSLGFDGVVVSDDLCMKAIEKPVPQACIQAYEAGVNCLLPCHNPPTQIQAVEEFIRYIEADLESRSRPLEESYRKIARAKKEIPLYEFDRLAQLSSQKRYEAFRNIQQSAKPDQLLAPLQNEPVG